jgi:peptidoglycan/xylan/chitin deacetylase (PgdA/CDA1 family)
MNHLSHVSAPIRRRVLDIVLMLAILGIGLGLSFFIIARPWFTPDNVTSVSPTPEPGVVVPVLMYHYVRPLPDPNVDRLGYGLSVSSETLREQLQYLDAKGYTTITPHELYEGLESPKSLPAKPILLTFDDGYADFYTAAYPLLKEFNMQASGLVTMGAHSQFHINVATNPRGPQEIVRSKEILEQRLSQKVTSFAYPSGAYSSEAIDTVHSAGFELAFTTEPGMRHTFDKRYVLPRVRIKGGMTIEDFGLAIKGVVTE